MASDNNLSWSATADKSWITVSPNSGQGSKKVTIKITPFNPDSDDITDLSGNVTFSCEGKSKVIEIIRKTCVTCQQVSNEIRYGTVDEVRVGPCITVAKISNVPYTSTTTYEPARLCQTNEITGLTSFTYTISDGKNNTKVERSYPFSVGQYNITTVVQEAGP